MSQFDVYVNPNKSSRAAYPYIVDIQSSVISAIASRIVVPLVRKVDMGQTELKGLTPTIYYEGEQLLLFIPQVSSMPAQNLKNPVGSISHLREEIISALDFAITGY